LGLEFVDDGRDQQHHKLLKLLIADLPVEISSSFAGRPLSRWESTKSESLVTKIRWSTSVTSRICSSVDRLPAGKSKVCIASQPAAFSQVTILRGN
jgi:hypothetical protein